MGIIILNIPGFKEVQVTIFLWGISSNKILASFNYPHFWHISINADDTKPKNKSLLMGLFSWVKIKQKQSIIWLRKGKESGTTNIELSHWKESTERLVWVSAASQLGNKGVPDVEIGLVKVFV